MKKCLLFLLLLVLAVSLCTAYAEDSVIINKIADPQNDFAFADDAQLLHVYFPKIHGNDSALVQYGEHTMLIDCAGGQWREVESLLKKLNITSLTYALNTHPDADHIGGFNHVLKNVPAKEFLLGFPEDYDEGDTVRFKIYNELHAMNISFRRVHNGDLLDFGDVQMTVYQRTDESLTRVNNKSVVLLVQLGERRILFTGDLQRDGQLLYVEDQSPIQAEILKFPHHGYNNMNPGFLALVDPELVVLTSGRKSADGAKQLKEAGITHYFAENGILHFATDGQVWLVERIK